LKLIRKALKHSFSSHILRVYEHFHNCTRQKVLQDSAAEASTLKGKRAADKSTTWYLFTQAILLLQIEEATAFVKGTTERHSKFDARYCRCLKRGLL